MHEQRLNFCVCRVDAVEVLELCQSSFVNIEQAAMTFNRSVDVLHRSNDALLWTGCRFITRLQDILFQNGQQLAQGLKCWAVCLQHGGQVREQLLLAHDDSSNPLNFSAR